MQKKRYKKKTSSLRLKKMGKINSIRKKKSWEKKINKKWTKETFFLENIPYTNRKKKLKYLYLWNSRDFEYFGNHWLKISLDLPQTATNYTPKYCRRRMKRLHCTFLTTDITNLIFSTLRNKLLAVVVYFHNNFTWNFFFFSIKFWMFSCFHHRSLRYGDIYSLSDRFRSRSTSNYNWYLWSWRWL